MNQWMQRAYELALAAAEKDEVPVGAVLVSKDEIIGIGSNDRESSGRTLAHAEILALEDYSRRTSQWRLPLNTSLFVTVEPCLMCTGALLWARVDKIFYACADPKNAGLQRILPTIESGVFDHRFSQVEGGLLGDPCAQLLKNYFARKRTKDTL